MTDLHTLLDRQRGLLTRAQLLAAGVPGARIDERVRTRAWTPVLPRTYLVRRGAPDDEVRVRAAVLWAGPDAVLVGVAAAWWHGIVARPPAVIGIADPHRTRTLRRPEVVAHARRPATVVEVRGLRITDASLTLVDAAVELGSAGRHLLAAANLRTCRGAAGPTGAHWMLRDLRHNEVVRRAAGRGRVPDHRVAPGSDTAARR